MSENDNAPDYMAEINDLSTLIDKGRELVNEGNSIDLSNLENSITDLCTRIANAPPANADDVTAGIAGLVDGLGKLSDALKTQTG